MYPCWPTCTLFLYTCSLSKEASTRELRVLPRLAFNHDGLLIVQVIKTHIADKSLVVLHCAFSQQRGPRCALRLKQRLLDLGMDDSKVQVLRGGFNNFAQQYSSDPLLVEEWDANMEGD